MAPSWLLLATAGGLANNIIAGAPRPRSNRAEVLGNRQYSYYQYITTIEINIFLNIANRILSIAWHIVFVSISQGIHPNFPTLVATTFPQPNCRDH